MSAATEAGTELGAGAAICAPVRVAGTQYSEPSARPLTGGDELKGGNQEHNAGPLRWDAAFSTGF